jgi:hypothetical protein
MLRWAALALLGSVVVALLAVATYFEQPTTPPPKPLVVEVSDLSTPAPTSPGRRTCASIARRHSRGTERCEAGPCRPMFPGS